MLAKTLPGLEEVLSREIKLLGGTKVEPVKRGVKFYGDLGFLYKSNLWLRTALRILVPISQFKVRNEKELYRKVMDINWEDIFDPSQTIVIDATVFSEKFTNSLFIAQKCKDAIADRFREKTGQRPSVNTQNPDVRINVHISRENVNISLDSSGDSLHKRGYRSKVDRAPISEVLAAGILSLTNWDKKSNLIDPMCGSGTFLIEAALMAYNIPPNVFRKNYCFKNWKNYDADLFALIFDKALEKEETFTAKIAGFDKDDFVLRKARKNLRSALMHEQIEISQADFLNFNEDLPESGTLVFNPPYGVKIEADIPNLYREIGDTLKNNFAGYTAWIFTSSQEGIKNIGLKPSKKIKLYNGKLECWLLKYELYSGSRKKSS